MYRTVEIYNDGVQHTHVFPKWAELVKHLQEFSAADKREVAVITIVNVNG